MSTRRPPLWPVVVSWNLIALAAFIVLPGDWKEWGVLFCMAGMLIHLGRRVLRKIATRGQKPGDNLERS